MADARRHAAQILDTGPVLILAAIAGAGSFVHIRDTAAQHGQRGPMAWAIAVCIDLTCVMAARERQRDKAHQTSHPAPVLARPRPGRRRPAQPRRQPRPGPA